MAPEIRARFLASRLFWRVIYTAPPRCGQCEHQLDNVPLTLVVETPWVHLAMQWPLYNADFVSPFRIPISRVFCFEILLKSGFLTFFFRVLMQPWHLFHASEQSPAYSTNQTELLSTALGVAGMPSVEPLCQGCPGAVTLTQGRYPLPTNQPTIKE